MEIADNRALLQSIGTPREIGVYVREGDGLWQLNTSWRRGKPEQIISLLD